MVCWAVPDPLASTTAPPPAEEAPAAAEDPPPPAAEEAPGCTVTVAITVEDLDSQLLSRHSVCMGRAAHAALFDAAGAAALLCPAAELPAGAAVEL